MAVTLVPLTAAERMAWMREMQEAFQSGAETELGAQEGEVLPQADIERSLQTPGAAAYEARLDGQRVGGALVVIHPESQRNHLDFLYVKRSAITWTSSTSSAMCRAGALVSRSGAPWRSATRIRWYGRR